MIQTAKRMPRSAATEHGANTKTIDVHYTSECRVCQAAEGETIDFDGKKIAADSYVEIPGIGTFPVPKLHMVTDYEWQLGALRDRLEHPEKYEATENVADVVARIRKWLDEHASD